MKYDDLVKALRHCATQPTCEGCPYDNSGVEESCSAKLKKLNFDAADAIEELSKPGWIPVSERLPEAFTPVIVCRKSTQGKTTATVEQGMLTVNGWWKVYGTRTKAVTHWMPLPQPPEEAQK